MPNLRVQHVSLDVDDLDAALAFYCDGLGFSVAPRPEALGDGGAWLDIGAGIQAFLNDPAGNLLELNQATA